MSFKVLTTSDFKKDFKALSKKYKSLKSDLFGLVEALEKNPQQGVPLGKNCYKVRMAIKSTGKGKSGGARVITYVKVIEGFVFLLTIYSKSDKNDISDKELDELIKSI